MWCRAPDTCECLKGFGGPSCDRLGTDVVFVHVALDFAEYDVNVMGKGRARVFGGCEEKKRGEGRFRPHVC